MAALIALADRARSSSFRLAMRVEPLRFVLLDRQHRLTALAAGSFLVAAVLFRYADDFMILFSDEADARRVYDVLPKRFGRYGLTLHPNQTRRIDFRKPRPPNGDGSGSFDLLGFTHVWARTRRGGFAVQRRTARGRFKRALQRVALWCREHGHRPIPEQHTTLSRMLRGHCAYYGITWNSIALLRFRRAMERLWVKWLGRRSQRARMTFERFRKLPALPPALAIHSHCRPAAPA